MCNKLLYYIDEEKNKKIKINNNNWHKYLSEYGWEKLDNIWKKKFNCIDKNFRFGIMDCGSEGDCMYYCVAEAINNPLNLLDIHYDYKELRLLTSEQINKNNYESILVSYKLAFDNNEFNGEWNPYSINNISDLKKEIKKPGNNFWGDHITLMLLQEALNINLILLSGNIDENDLNDCKIISLFQDLKYEKTIILYYIENIHFKLIGYFDKYMKTIFNKNDLPNEIIRLL